MNSNTDKITIDSSPATTEGLEEIGKLLLQESIFLSMVMTDASRRKLVVEWRKQAALVDVAVQATTENSHMGTQVW